ncbi:MAG: O-methyltransferase [Clostridia bacterium]|nr:O-methyltransferase [Clostridia bacterium]
MQQLDKILQFARQNYIPVMLDDTRQLLFDLVSKAQPSKILEIGTAIGYSGIIMLTASKGATLNTIEMDEDSVKLAKSNFAQAGLLDKVNFFVGDAREIVHQLTGNYDFIFLDGPKGQYLDFLPYLLEVLNVGGTLVCDNVLYKGLVENQPENGHKHVTIARNLKQFLHQLQTNPTLQTQLYHTGDGVSVSIKLS